MSNQRAGEVAGDEHACAADCTSRRAMLAGAGAVGVAALLGGCQTYGNEPPAPPAGNTDPSKPAASGVPAEPTGDPILVSKIPVGGGIIVEDAAVVITRPDDKTVKAFSAICTHQGCVVSGVSDGKITCGCHGSEFKITDGTVAKGPAKAKLQPAKFTVAGDTITLG